MSGDLGRDGDQPPDGPDETFEEHVRKAERAAIADPDAPSIAASPWDGRPTRQEYYNQLRRDMELDRARGHGTGYQRQDAPPGGTVWDLVPAPGPEDIHLPGYRREAILHGHPDQDPHEGGHLHGTGKPGVSEFPPSWDGDKITETALSVARDPETIDWVDPAENPESTTLYPPYWEVRSDVEGLIVAVTVRKNGEIADTWPDAIDPDSGVRYNEDPLHPQWWVTETARELREQDGEQP